MLAVTPRPYVFSYANRPSGEFPCGRLPGVCFCFYPGASALVPRIANGRMAACQSWFHIAENLLSITSTVRTTLGEGNIISGRSMSP